MTSPRPTWGTVTGALGVVLERRNLVRTCVIALIVGTVLFAINQLDVVLSGEATPAVWVKSVVTYVVPFVVSNVGVLTATYEPVKGDSQAPSPRS